MLRVLLDIGFEAPVLSDRVAEAFKVRLISPVEINYKIHNKGILAIVEGIGDEFSAFVPCFLRR